MARYDSVLETIGNTPLVRLSRLAPPGVAVYVKLESMNPMGSVKDRMANAVIERAEATGELRPGQTVIEATSGNTGIGLAMVCARKGYPLVVTMAESFSIERRKMLRFLGAKVVLTPASEKGTGMLNKAIELAKKHGWYLCRQFERGRALEDDPAGDHRRLRGRAAPLLRLRLRHGRHAEGRSARPQGVGCEDAGRRRRAGQRPAARQRDRTAPRVRR